MQNFSGLAGLAKSSDLFFNLISAFKKKKKKPQEHYLKSNYMLEFYLLDEMPTTKRTLKIKQESSEDTQ